MNVHCCVEWVSDFLIFATCLLFVKAYVLLSVLFNQRVFWIITWLCWISVGCPFGYCFNRFMTGHMPFLWPNQECQSPAEKWASLSRSLNTAHKYWLFHKHSHALSGSNNKLPMLFSSFLDFFLNLDTPLLHICWDHITQGSDTRVRTQKTHRVFWVRTLPPKTHTSTFFYLILVYTLYANRDASWYCAI